MNALQGPVIIHRGGRMWGWWIYGTSHVFQVDRRRMSCGWQSIKGKRLLENGLLRRLRKKFDFQGSKVTGPFSDRDSITHYKITTYSHRVVSDLSAINFSWKVFKHACVLLKNTSEQNGSLRSSMGTRNSPKNASLHIYSSLMPSRKLSSIVLLNESLGKTLPHSLFDMMTQSKVLLYWTLRTVRRKQQSVEHAQRLTNIQ